MKTKRGGRERARSLDAEGRGVPAARTDGTAAATPIAIAVGGTTGRVECDERSDSRPTGSAPSASGYDDETLL